MAEYPDQGGGPKTQPLLVNRAAAPQPKIGGLRCPHCGANTPPGGSVCPACGERLDVRPRKVRCRQCGGNASTQLVICPHCGRELRPAPPRPIAWGIPLVLAALLFILAVWQWGRLNPLGRIQEQTGAAMTWLREWGESLDPQITVVSVAGAPDLTFLPAASQKSIATIAGDVGEPAPEANAPVETVQVVTMTLATATAALEPIVAPTLAATETPTPLPSDTPTATETPTSSPTPQPTATFTPVIATMAANAPGVQTVGAITATTGVTTTGSRMSDLAATRTPGSPFLPSPTPTPPDAAAAALLLPSATPTLEIALATATPRIYAVQAGDTAMGIALRFRVPLAELIRVNGFTAQEARLLRPGQQILLPSDQAPQPVAASLPTPTSTLAGTSYTVQSGDTIIGIASRTGVSVESILNANAMTEKDAPSIRPGDNLLIPAPGQIIAPPTATPTNEPSPSPSPTLTATRIPATPTATPVVLRLDAPVLRSPESGSAVSCTGGDKLVWSPVQFVKETDRYRMNLGYVSGRDTAGNPVITWVIQQLQPAGITQWNMDPSLCSLAPQEMGREWRWYVDLVEVVDGAVIPVSPPSDMWGFSWN